MVNRSELRYAQHPMFIGPKGGICGHNIKKTTHRNAIPSPVHIAIFGRGVTFGGLSAFNSMKNVSGFDVSSVFH